ncbi:hypothetical protein FPQ18DRAFT_352375 [Pyronema domesticum]|uniref:Uncharacterized protein n=1 Tax=Pyronema omphalodes (strain CBS 100304) TaxID=1076935 RepID=U4L4Q2_PYROM|nr:hypothetical protein FPQ18DRAFT_352375 [Pyronema domesticum]CCX07283.1 Similar to hypothetical protein [Tuber melanosporum Mel28]; acc. no. XP_002835599 [Pyronema omphalodes CBS 100304]
MVLDSIPDIPPDGSPPVSDSERTYPPPPPIPSFILTSGSFNEANRSRFINLTLAMAARDFNFHPTPVEYEGLSYYQSVFYSAEALGAMSGTLAGGLIGCVIAYRQKNPGFLFRQLPLSPQYRLWGSKLVNVIFITGLGRVWGMTSYGVKAWNEISRKQKEDPNMQRYLKMKNAWLEQRKRNAEKGVPVKAQVNWEEVKKMAETPVEVQTAERERLQGTYGAQAFGGQTDQDEQGLGGPFFEEKKWDGGVEEQQQLTRAQKWEQAARNREQRTKEEAARALAKATGKDEDEDPFFGGSEQEEREPVKTEEPKSGWRNTQSIRGGSAWDRLRRGVRQEGEMETKGDSFAFSNSDREREIAKEEAQREFDLQVERERLGEGQDGFVGEGRRRR